MDYKTLLAATLAVASAAVNAPTQMSNFRPPAIPLVTHDPYFSIWSTTDTLNGGTTRHWTGKEHPLMSVIKVDDKSFTLMGASSDAAPALPQKSVSVLPTRTIYSFANSEVEVKLTFCSPLLPDNLDILSRPATYITWEVRALDSRSHHVVVSVAVSGLLPAGGPDEEMEYGSISRDFGKER